MGRVEKGLVDVHNVRLGKRGSIAASKGYAWRGNKTSSVVRYP